MVERVNNLQFKINMNQKDHDWLDAKALRDDRSRQAVIRRLMHDEQDREEAAEVAKKMIGGT